MDGVDVQRNINPEPTLIDAALINGNSEAVGAIMEMLAQIKDGHAHLPAELFVPDSLFRMYSDNGQEFLSNKLE